MARTEIVVAQIVRTGVALSPDNPGQADGYKFQNDGQVVCFCYNTNGGATRTITFQTPQSIDGLAITDLTITDLTITLATVGSARWIGPFPRRAFNQQGTDKDMVYVDFDAAGPTDVHIICLHL